MNYSDRKRLAQELVLQDRYPEALSEYTILFKENPKDLDNIESFIFLFNRINDGHYDFEPENAEHYVMRGIAKFYREEIESSIDDYNKALVRDPNYHYALKTKAFSLKFLGRFEEAITDLNNAINIQPSGEYYDDLADIYALIGDIETAFKYHQKAIEYSPHEARLWYNYGVDLAENGQLEEAITKFDKAIELWPEYEDAILNRQQILNHIGKS